MNIDGYQVVYGIKFDADNAAQLALSLCKKHSLKAENEFHIIYYSYELEKVSYDEFIKSKLEEECHKNLEFVVITLIELINKYYESSLQLFTERCTFNYRAFYDNSPGNIILEHCEKSNWIAGVKVDDGSFTDEPVALNDLLTFCKSDSPEKTVVEGLVKEFDLDCSHGIFIVPMLKNI